MSYVQRTLRPGEVVLHQASLHWIVFVPAIILFGIAAKLSPSSPAGTVLFALLGALAMLKAAVAFWTTEIVVTDRRFLLKRGLVGRETVEINHSQAESVDLLQPAIARLFDYGTLVVQGSGSTKVQVQFVAAPLKLRNSMPHW